MDQSMYGELALLALVNFTHRNDDYSQTNKEADKEEERRLYEHK